jgi:site-specific DNA recombinase
MPDRGKPVGIWIRVSTEDQAQGDSPGHHEARAQHYAAAKGWTVKEVYNLAGVSVLVQRECPFSGLSLSYFSLC